jgi:tetratricopeptide (TPR) repeat protein
MRAANSLKPFLLVVFSGVYFSAVAQKQTQDYTKNTQHVLQEKFTSVDSLSKYILPFRRDTTLLLNFISTSKNNSYIEGMAFGYNSMGIYNRDKSNYSKAIEYHKKSIELATKLMSDELMISAHNMLGVVYRRMNKVRMALDNHQLALSIAQNSSKKSNAITKGITISHNSIGNLYLTLKQYDLAEEQFRKSLVLEEKIGSKLGLAINYHNIGYSYEFRGIYDEALTNYRRSLDYNNQINSSVGKVICNNSIAQVYLKQGNVKDAAALIIPTLKESEEIGDNFYIAMANVNAGWAYIELKDYNTAEKYLQNGLKISQENNLQSFEAEAYEHLANLSEIRGNYKNALTYYKAFEEKEAQFLNEDNQRYISDLLIKYDAEQKKNKIELLEKENEIINIKLAQSNKVAIFSILLGALGIGLLFILNSQRKLKAEKKLLTMEQKLLRSQMNPHFIFNSLLSIKLFMLNNDRESAVAYLDQFSKLVRTILSTSLEKEISLAEELDTMKLYVNIENSRLMNEIDYKVTLDESLDLDNVKIPSLTLQPFIENALWHGLSAKEGYKSLEVNVKKNSENYVEISITDNGIGREQTMKIETEKKKSQRKSIGINLTKERLANFSKNFANMHTLNIIDLYNNTNNPMGTKVVLQIPVK